jgi:hypothetical protein
MNTKQMSITDGPETSVVEYVGRRNPSGERDDGPVAHKGLHHCVGPL